MSLKRVLIVNKSFPLAGLEILKKKVDVSVVPFMDHEPESLPTIKRYVKGVDAIIWNTKYKLNGEILDLSGPQLKTVSTMSSGIDQIDEEALKKRGISLGNTPKVLDNAVADITVGLLIAAARRFKEGIADLHSGSWKYGVCWTIGQDIAGSTVGIVGFGGVGQAIIRRLKGFDVAKFIYSGRSDKPEAITLGIERVATEKLLKESDFIVLSCPLTEETKNMINEDSINLMKKNAILINIARGDVIDQNALYKALKEQRIFAAGLDVTTPEPLPKDHALLSLPNCFIIPHMGSATTHTRDAMSKISANNVLLALEGKLMQCPFSPRLDNAVADITVGLLIAAARRFKEGIADLHSGSWKYGVCWTIGQDIAGSTVGIVGFGGVGQAIIRRLKGFDVAKFIYSGRSDKPEAITLGIERVATEKLLKESDFIVLSCPLTEETKNMINEDSINLMKKNAILINIARGDVIDQNALYKALKEQRIFAAGLDVTTPEPLPKDHALLSLPNCFIIPHMGSATTHTRDAMSKISANNVLLALEGKLMQCPVF